jgi:hypothetical protein
MDLTPAAVDDDVVRGFSSKVENKAVWKGAAFCGIFD